MKPPLTPQSVHDSLAALRAAMHAQGVTACLVPSADPHLSEYLPDHWQIRQWLTGFTGSVGTVVVTAGFAGLWVDSRYWVQAESELAGSGFSVMKTASAAEVCSDIYARPTIVIMIV